MTNHSQHHQQTHKMLLNLLDFSAQHTRPACMHPCTLQQPYLQIMSHHLELVHVHVSRPYKYWACILTSSCKYSFYSILCQIRNGLVILLVLVLHQENVETDKGIYSFKIFKISIITIRITYHQTRLEKGRQPWHTSQYLSVLVGSPIFGI